MKRKNLSGVNKNSKTTKNSQPPAGCFFSLPQSKKSSIFVLVAVG